MVGPNKSGESYGGNRCLNNDYIIKPFKGNIRSSFEHNFVYFDSNSHGNMRLK